MTRIVYLNGTLLPFEEAKLPIMDRGFLFADGVYEVTTVIGGKLVDFASHCARLRRSAGEIGIAVPVDDARLLAIHRDLVARNALDEGTVYLQLTRGAAERDFLAPEGLEPTLLMFTQAKAVLANPAAETGIAVASVPDLRWERRDIKSVMLLAQVLAKRAAHEAGAQDAWMVEPDGMVTEGASSTAWIVTQDGRLVTRAKSHKTLPGCTGLALEALIAETDLRLEHRPFPLDEAFAAAEAFNTSASAFVLPVVTVNGRAIGKGVPGPVTKRLRDLYLAFARDTAV
jgi:D-alanine transaminase